jgi:hypothetical protein
MGGLEIGTGNSEYDSFVLKVDSCGNLLWSNRYGFPSIDAINKITIDSSGNIVFNIIIT